MISLCKLDQIPSSVVEHIGRDRSHSVRRLRELHAR
jgi:hypothetical protein